MFKRKKKKRTNNDLQNAKQKSKDPATRTGKLSCSESVSSSFTTCTTRCDALATNPVLMLGVNLVVPKV